MNEISKDIEKERLLSDCKKLQRHRLREYEGDMESIIDICLSEEMEAEDVQQIVFDNALMVANIYNAISILCLKGEYFIADMISQTLDIKLSELPVKYIV